MPYNPALDRSKTSKVKPKPRPKNPNKPISSSGGGSGRPSSYNAPRPRTPPSGGVDYPVKGPAVIPRPMNPDKPVSNPMSSPPSFDDTGSGVGSISMPMPRWGPGAEAGKADMIETRYPGSGGIYAGNGGGSMPMSMPAPPPMPMYIDQPMQPHPVSDIVSQDQFVPNDNPQTLNEWYNSGPNPKRFGGDIGSALQFMRRFQGGQ